MQSLIFFCACIILADGLFFKKLRQGDTPEDESPEKTKFKDKIDTGQEEYIGYIKPTLASPPPVGTGLYATVQKLQEQVLNLQQIHEKERSKIRRLERRVKECKDGVSVTKSDIIQLKQSVREVTLGYKEVQDTVQDVKVQTSSIDFKMKKKTHEYSNLREQVHSNSKTLGKLRGNLTEIGESCECNTSKSERKWSSLHDEVQALSAKQSQYSRQLASFNKLIDSALTVSLNETKTTYQVNLANGTNFTTDVLEGVGDWDEGSGEIEKEYILSSIGEEPVDFPDVSGDGELPDFLPDYEELAGFDDVIDLRVNISTLETSMQNLENLVRRALASNDTATNLKTEVKDLIKEEYEKFEILAEDRDEALAQIQNQYNSMDEKITAIDQKIRSIELGDFMRNLQESMINFTQNVLTLDQWKTASNQMINSTQSNQHQIMKLKGQLVNNTKLMNKLKWKTTNGQTKIDQQYRVLQMHIINLNNSMQDLREHVTYIGSMQSSSRGRTVPGSNTRYLPPSTDVLSRLEDLGLQIIYNENRIAKIESMVLNRSLFECQKANTDLFQDSKLVQLEHEIIESKSTVGVMKEMFKRLDRAIYRVHAYAKNSSDVIYKLQSKFFSWDVYIPIIQLMRQEVSNLLFTLPIDCDSYRQRGFTENGIYVIFPPNAMQSFKIPCVMDDEGGWTVIQRRMDGKTKFARSWSEYAVGFGNPTSEFWIGNEFLHLLTSKQNYSLQIEMTDIFDGYWQVNYDYFYVASKNEEYRLSIHGYSGNATDGMAYSDDMAFSTQDSDNDLSSTHCALYYTAGWWYRHCQYSNLNGRYDVGVVWFNKEWQDWIQLKATTMKIRPQVNNQTLS